MSSDKSIYSSQNKKLLNYLPNIDYKELAGRIAISNHHKKTKTLFSEVMEIL